MHINIATWDRVLRMIVGVLIFAWAIAGGPLWGYLGPVLIATAAWRFDPLYAIFRTGTFRDWT
jgi:hypothetical protein